MAFKIFALKAFFYHTEHHYRRTASRQRSPNRLGVRIRQQTHYVLVTRVARLFVAAKGLGHVAVIKAVHPQHACL